MVSASFGCGELITTERTDIIPGIQVHSFQMIIDVNDIFVANFTLGFWLVRFQSFLLISTFPLGDWVFVSLVYL